MFNFIKVAKIMLQMEMNKPVGRKLYIIRSLALVLCITCALILHYYSKFCVVFKSQCIFLTYGLLCRLYCLASDMIYKTEISDYSLNIFLENNFWNWKKSHFIYFFITALSWIIKNKVTEETMTNMKASEDSVVLSIVEFVFPPTLFVLCDVLNVNDFPIKKAITIENQSSSWAVGMFYGYLKIIAEELKDRMLEFESNERITIPVKKLFILIPSSAYIIDKFTDDILECTQSLRDHVKTRAGTYERKYSNSVCKVKNKKTEDIYYVVLESATPMKTFYEAFKENGVLAEHKRETVYAFYNTLQNFINENPEVKEVVELVYYNDDKKPGCVTQIADVVVKRIELLKQKLS